MGILHLERALLSFGRKGELWSIEQYEPLHIDNFCSDYLSDTLSFIIIQ